MARRPIRADALPIDCCKERVCLHRLRALLLIHSFVETQTRELVDRICCKSIGAVLEGIVVALTCANALRRSTTLAADCPQALFCDRKTSFPATREEKEHASWEQVVNARPSQDNGMAEHRDREGVKAYLKSAVNASCVARAPSSIATCVTESRRWRNCSLLAA